MAEPGRTGRIAGRRRGLSLPLPLPSLLLLLPLLLWLSAALPPAAAQGPCSGKKNCSECIRTPTCSWCSSPFIAESVNHTGLYAQGMEDSRRCFQSGVKCPKKYIVNPSIEYKVLRQEALTEGRARGGARESAKGEAAAAGGGRGSASGSSSSSSWSSSTSHRKIVQIYPQHVSLKLRINEARRIKFTYSQAEDYPVDLYYLMDLSKSMEDDKDKLSSLGIQLAESMRNITSNFRLGFGSFVDKVVMPYVSTVPKKLQQPCDQCAAPYGFRNHMALADDANYFTEKVRSAAVSGNLDAPEGGFDAIMQAIVCREQIGWREQARRLLVFSTDAGFHYAGDGKLGGIVKPNDGECHLDERGMYTHSEKQDYPSISQINLKVRENSMNVIFAVTQEQIRIYEQLQGHIEGASSGNLSSDSSNIVDLVVKQYETISSVVEIRDNASSSVVQLRYFTSGIEGKGGVLKENNSCAGLKVGSKVNFEVEFLASKCPKNRADWKQHIKIYPVAIDESLIVDLELLCDCPCERAGDPGFVHSSVNCSSRGDYMCGVCRCDDEHFGRRCECDSQGEGRDLLGVGVCRPDNTTEVDCSGRGICICGECECDKRPNPEEIISGDFCECDNFQCNYNLGKMCSGPEHGTCVCGKCVCKPGWEGNACECSTAIDTCIQPGTSEVCSGHGTCNCGACVCDPYGEEEGSAYTGQFCERHPVSSTQCSEYRACVQCQMYQKGELNEDECATNCTKFVPLPVDHVEADEEKQERLCVYHDEDDCRYKFVYVFNGTDIVIRAQETLDCPAAGHFLGVVFIVIGAIVLIGLAILMLWKLLTTIHDRREFAKFEKERMLAKWDTGENPIYKQATSTFKNPTYAGKN